MEARPAAAMAATTGNCRTNECYNHTYCTKSTSVHYNPYPDSKMIGQAGGAKTHDKRGLLSDRRCRNFLRCRATPKTAAAATAENASVVAATFLAIRKQPKGLLQQTKRLRGECLEGPSCRTMRERVRPTQSLQFQLRG